MRRRLCTLDVAVRGALHVAGPVGTAVTALRSQIRHQLLVAIVAVTPPGFDMVQWRLGR